MKCKFDEVERGPVGTYDYRPHTSYVGSRYNPHGEFIETTLFCFLKGYSEGDIMEYADGGYTIVHFEYEPGLRDAPEDVRHGVASIPEWVAKTIYEPWQNKKKRGEMIWVFFLSMMMGILYYQRDQDG